MTKRGFANASVSTGSEHMVLEREKMPPKKRLLKKMKAKRRKMRGRRKSGCVCGSCLGCGDMAN